MNLAIIEDGVLLTPPADDILEGCTVRRAMELVTECVVLSHLGVTDARYEDVDIDRAKAADEVMVSLSLLSYGQLVLHRVFLFTAHRQRHLVSADRRVGREGRWS